MQDCATDGRQHACRHKFNLLAAEGGACEKLTSVKEFVHFGLTSQVLFMQTGRQAGRQTDRQTHTHTHNIVASSLF